MATTLFWVRNAICLGLLACPAFANPITVDFDPARSKINWVLTGNVHTVHGTFRLKTGHVVFDPASGTMSGEVVVDAVSGESGNGSRDKRMHKDILESERFPEIRLTVKKVDGAVGPAGHSLVRITGDFAIHGSSHDITIPMDVSLTGAQVNASGKFSVPYVDWGMKDPSNFLFKVDQAVEVEIEAVGRPAPK